MIKCNKHQEYRKFISYIVFQIFDGRGDILYKTANVFKSQTKIAFKK